MGAVAVAVADTFHETAFFIRQGAHTLALDFFEQFVQAALVGDTLLLLALGLGGLATLPPALEPALLAARRSGRRFVALQAGVALREVVAEQRVLAPRLQQEPLLFAGDVDEDRQRERQRVLVDDGVNAD